MAAYPNTIRPNLVVVTSIGSEHNRSFKGLEATRSEKAEMIRPLDSSATVILNGDDPNVLWMRDQTRARVVTFGLGPDCDFVATDVELDWPAGTRFNVRCSDGVIPIRTRLIGRPGVEAALAAVTVAVLEGLALPTIAAMIDTLEPTPGRLEPVRLENGAYLLQDDYKASLETVHTALDVLESIDCRRKLIIMGEVSEPPGSQGPVYRALGERMGRITDKIVLVGGNFQRYAAGAAAVGFPRDAIVDAGRDFRRASDAIADDLAAGDVVLIKGRDTQSLIASHCCYRGTRYVARSTTARPAFAAPAARCWNRAGDIIESSPEVQRPGGGYSPSCPRRTASPAQVSAEVRMRAPSTTKPISALTMVAMALRLQPMRRMRASSRLRSLRERLMISPKKAAVETATVAK